MPRRDDSSLTPQPNKKNHQDDGGDAGPVERKTREDVEALFSAHPVGESLAEIAFSLARTLDDGAGMAAAAVARELRATLVELSRMAVEDDDDFGDELSTPVRDQEEP